jgi:hypothetical protein
MMALDPETKILSTREPREETKFVPNKTGWIIPFKRHAKVFTKVSRRGSSSELSCIQ